MMLMARKKAARRIERHGIWSHLAGLWLRRRFQRAGIIVVNGGLPFPEVDNQGGQIRIGNCGVFSGVRLECWANALIEVGDGTYLNRNVEIVAARSVKIGRDCKIARDVLIMDTDQHALPGDELTIKPVEIQDRAWIGAKSIVLKGVTIGRDAVVAAGSVVTKDVPSGTVVAGVPARVVRRLHVGGETE
jgi:acetyltransferase-like isoleucine patch superfamily enzyme